MSDVAEFRSSRGYNALLGIGLAALAVVTAGLPFYASEQEFLGTRIRRGGGILKLIEQTIGWQLFTILMVAFGLWLAVYGVVHLWKAIDTTPDVSARQDQVDFHPAVRGSSASYHEISHWRLEFVSGHPVLWIHFHEPYWSLQGLFKRTTVKLEGGKEQIEPLVNFFARHEDMGQKFVQG